MTLIVHDVALEMVEEIAPLLRQLGGRDAKLMDQLRRSASSVVLNINEGRYSLGGNKRARYHTAAGSNAETRSCLRVAVAWGFVDRKRAAVVDALLDRIQAMLWRLCHRR